MQQHRISLTEEHYHMARRFMVVNRLPSARIAVQKMIEIVAERREEKKGSVDDRGEVEFTRR
jgi:hypothetical protein